MSTIWAIFKNKLFRHLFLMQCQLPTRNQKSRQCFKWTMSNISISCMLTRYEVVRCHISKIDWDFKERHLNLMLTLNDTSQDKANWNGIQVLANKRQVWIGTQILFLYDYSEFLQQKTNWNLSFSKRKTGCEKSKHESLEKHNMIRLN